MSLCLVLHDLEGPLSPEAEQVFFSAVFEIAPAHWRVMEDATLVGTEVSPGYLLDYLRQAARRAAVAPRLLMVLPVSPDLAAHGLPPEGAAWLREMLETAG